uniref:Desmoglein 2 n=1 Tax=Astyanax mexicanus TaxID=7994 RepID=A0A3B1J7N9_ASTMX
MIFYLCFVEIKESSLVLRRHKREWIVPPQVLEENVDYTKKEFIIRSDKDDGQKNLVRYALRGVGVDQSPFNLFVVNPDNGNVRITGLLDRESIPQFNLSGVATFINGTVAENDIQLRIKVKDQNDNAPIFPPSISPGSVYELSPVGTSVMRITATDADEPGNPNSQIRYEIINQDPAGAAMFRIAPNGDVLVNDANLDREYTLTVKASDLNGAPGCKSGTATFKIQLKDVNDNVPKLEKEAVREILEVMRIKATDLDEQGTDNWQAKFNIVSGNEGGHFSIYTDPNTNEGVLMLDKVLIFFLQFFLKAIPISEDGKTFDVTKLIATYPAIDGDTKLPAENVRYAKGLDPGNWLSIDEKTSPHLVNGTYTAKVLCISQDAPYTTATGTIAIQVEDFNDHCPTLTTNVQTMCTIQEAIYVTAVDEDAPPNAAPFTFSIVPEKTKGKWSVEHLNDTTAILRSHEPLWPGPREVTVEVRDEQGLSCPEPQVLKLDVCSCDKNGLCGVRGAQQKGAVLGKAGIGLLLLGLLMLLLIPLLLLFCQCGAAGMGGAFAEMPFDTKEHLIAYHTEGQGEDRVSPEILSIFHRAGYMASTFSGGGGYQMEMTTMDHGMSAAGLGMMREEFDDGMALSGEYLNQYYSQKSMELDATAKNSLLMYNYEGQGSPVGSIGCCSLLESDNDLEFLNNLGPKFTTLAEICGAVSIETHRVNTVNVPPKPAASSSVHTVENVMVTNSRASVAADVKPATTLINVKPSQTLIDVQPAQTLMVQQQPMYYVVEPQVSNTMLLAERPTVGLGQNVYMLNGAPMAERVLVQGAVPAQGTIGGGNRVMLLETGRGSTQALNTGLLQSANLSGSQLLLVDGAAQGGQVLQGTLNRGGLAGSQGLLLVDGQSGPMLQGSLQRGVATSGSQNMLFMEAQGGSSGVFHGLMQRGMTSSAGSQSGTVGLNTGSVQISGVPSTRKVVIQEKKVVSTQQSSL